MSTPIKKRQTCGYCQRPIKTCICHLIEPIHAPIDLAILQHPSEVKNTKGTAWLAHQSILNSHWFIGESMSALPELQAWLKDDQAYLLYPFSEQQSSPQIKATDLVTSSLSQKAKTKVVVLDGTWRKTFRLVQSNPQLAELPRISLSGTFKTNYVIRKSSRIDSLSTIEAIYSLLTDVDPNGYYDSLLNSFNGLMAMHQLYRSGSG